MAGPLRVERDIKVARWLPAALTDDTTVACVVPPLFEAYVRILHPASLDTPNGETDAWGNAQFTSREITWAEAASLIGDRLGDRQPWTLWLSRFGEVGRDLPDGSRMIDGHVLPDGSSIQEPHQGDIPVDLLVRLTEVLLEHEGDAEVLAAVWEGSGLDPSGSGIYSWVSDDGSRSPQELEREAHEQQDAHRAALRASVDPEILQAMRREHVLGLPGEQQGRGHVLMRGRLSTFADPAWEREAGLGWSAEWPFQGRTPNVIWPTHPHAQPAWFVATELDLDVTFVGGSAKLIGRLVADPAFETERIRLTDTLVERDGAH